MIDNFKRKRHTQGLRVLSHVLEDKSWGILSDNEIKDTDFFADSKSCLRFIRKYFGEHGEFPAKDIVEDKASVIFPSEAAKSFCVDEFNRYKLSLKIKEIMQATNELAMSNPNECLLQIKQKILDIEYTNRVESFKSSGLSFYQEYIKDKIDDTKGIIPAYPGMQDNFDIYENGTINAILGVSGSGKSWLSCVTALFAAFNQDKKVILFSMENPKKSMDQRLNALYHKIPFGSLKRGIVDIRTEKHWRERLPGMEKELGDLWVIDNAKTVGDILNQIAAINPDFVIVDGAYKLDTSRGGNAYEKSSIVLQELENAAKMCDIPLLCSSQLNKDAQTAKGGRAMAFEARFNKEWLMNPSTVCCLTQTDDDLKFSRVKCTIAKNRDSGDSTGLQQEFMINEDKILMDFSQAEEDFVDSELISQIMG